MKKDNQLMALLSVWGILLVVLGHSGFEEPEIQQNLGRLHGWIYSFHMPLFFMISGYLFSLTNKSFVDIQLGNFIQKKVLRLLVPYVTIGSIVYLIKFAFSSLSHASRDFTIGNFFYMFIAPSNPNSTMGYLWYIVTLFVVFAIVVLLNKLRIDMKKPLWCLVLILVFLALDSCMPKVVLFNLNAVIHYMPAFLMGILFKKYEDSILTFINRGGYLNLLIVSLLTIVLTIYRLPVPSSCIWVVRFLAGVWMSISLCSIILRSSKISGFLLPFSKYTYSIYLLSWFGQYAAKVLLINILHLHWSIAVVAMFICGIVVPLFVDKCVDRWFKDNKAIRLIIGY